MALVDGVESTHHTRPGYVVCLQGRLGVRHQGEGALQQPVELDPWTTSSRTPGRPPEATGGPRPVTGKARGARGGMEKVTPSMQVPGRFWGVEQVVVSTCLVARVKEWETEVGTGMVGLQAGTIAS